MSAPQLLHRTPWNDLEHGKFVNGTSHIELSNVSAHRGDVHPTAAAILPLIGPRAKNNWCLRERPWLICPPDAELLLRNVLLCSLKSLDGYSMISPGCGDHISRKTGCERGCVRRLGKSFLQTHPKRKSPWLPHPVWSRFNLRIICFFFYVKLCVAHLCVALTQRYFWDWCQTRALAVWRLKRLCQAHLLYIVSCIVYIRIWWPRFGLCRFPWPESWTKEE